MTSYYISKLTRAIAFALGDLRGEMHFPWFSTKPRTHLIEPEEIVQALGVARFGDIGLHRDRGFFTNLTIPGALKHAWIHTHDIENADGTLITEATSDGVCSRHALTPLLSDYALILRPRGLTQEQRKGACIRARQIQGADYDVDFKFDMEQQNQFYETPNNLETATAELHMHEAALARWSLGFSCSEAVAYCYWHVRETLQIYRRPVLGREAILPQDFLNFEFDVVWASKSLDLVTAKQLGFDEQALSKLESYQKGLRT